MSTGLRSLHGATSVLGRMRTAVLAGMCAARGAVPLRNGPHWIGMLGIGMLSVGLLLVGPSISRAQSPALDSQSSHVERTLFDIYVADSFQGGVLADYSEQWLEIENPTDVVEQIKELEAKDTTSLIPLFSGRIEGTRVIEGIGSITYDIYTFRIIITLDPGFLKARSVKLTDRLPDPERGFSIQQNLAVAASGRFQGIRMQLSRTVRFSAMENSSGA